MDTSGCVCPSRPSPLPLWVRSQLLFSPLQDLPSFTQNVHRLVNDLRYYRLCNDSLPPGTVKL